MLKKRTKSQSRACRLAWWKYRLSGASAHLLQASSAKALPDNIKKQLENLHYDLEQVLESWPKG
jgi:hypothetical protein